MLVELMKLMMLDALVMQKLSPDTTEDELTQIIDDAKEHFGEVRSDVG